MQPSMQPPSSNQPMPALDYPQQNPAQQKQRMMPTKSDPPLPGPRYQPAPLLF
jgi:hypothetical protein